LSPKSHQHWAEDETDAPANPWVWERKYEIDSLCFPLQLAYLFWQATGRTDHFDQRFYQAARTIVDLWTHEQRHAESAEDRAVCACTRRELDAAADAAPGGRARNEEHVYPGTCRHGVAGRTVRSWRLRVDGEAASKLGNDGPRIEWRDRRLGLQCQDVPREIGDFVLKRADGVWAYQLAVVVDDAAEGITDVVRGEDLASNTARQIVLQGKLGLPTPRYLHLPLVRGADGEKLSKQNGAVALAVDAPLDALRQAGLVLGVEVMGSNVAEWLAQAASAWPYRRLG